MSEPTPYNFGNPSDDDGQVIDSLFIETDMPPAVETLPMAASMLQEKPQRTTRLITLTQRVGNGWDPVMLLPADVNRKKIIIRAWGIVVNQELILGDTRTGVQDTSSGANVLYSGAGFLIRPTSRDVANGTEYVPWYIEGHTGELWVAPGNENTVDCYISVMAVSR